MYKFPALRLNKNVDKLIGKVLNTDICEIVASFLCYMWSHPCKMK